MFVIFLDYLPYVLFSNNIFAKMVREIEESLVYAYPEFKLQSYIGSESLVHDLAVVRLRRGVGRIPRTKMARSARLPRGTRMRSREGSKVKIVGQHRCNRGGLGPSQICLQGNSSSPRRQGEEGLDPRQGYYRAACLHMSGAPILLPSCRVAALLLTPDCQGGGIGLNLSLYSAWVRAATTTDLLRTGGWKDNKSLRRQLRGEVKRARRCKEEDSRDVYKVKGEGLGPPRLVEGTIEWGELSPSLAVVTQCGVEVRCWAGFTSRSGSTRASSTPPSTTET